MFPALLYACIIYWWRNERYAFGTVLIDEETITAYREQDASLVTICVICHARRPHNTSNENWETVAKIERENRSYFRLRLVNSSLTGTRLNYGLLDRETNNFRLSHESLISLISDTSKLQRKGKASKMKGNLSWLFFTSLNARSFSIWIFNRIELQKIKTGFDFCKVRFHSRYVINSRVRNRLDNRDEYLWAFVNR